MEIKKSKQKLPVVTLLFAVLTFIGGILLLVLPNEWIDGILVFAVILLLFVYGTVRLVQCLLEEKYLLGILSLAISWIGSVGLIMAQAFFVDLAVIPGVIVGVVSLLIALIRLLICVNCVRNHVSGAWRNGISAFFCLLFGVMMVIFPISSLGLLGTVAGCYLLFYAVTMFGDFFAAVFHADMSEDKAHRRTHFAVPNLITAIQPSRMIKKINAGRQQGNITSGMIIEQTKDSMRETVNVEIMVHLTTQGANKFGHVDLAIGDKIYSYGTYDSSQNRYGGFVSQGMFIIVPKIPYLKYCLTCQQKYVIGFGAHLSDKQVAAVRENIQKFMEDCVPFESCYEAAVKNGEDGTALNDPASCIVRDVGGKVYTVTKGQFRRYFGININCVKAADRLLADSGIDRLSFSGISTPGGYYSMLDNMFYRKNTRIIRKTFYIDADEIDDIEELRALAGQLAAEKAQSDAG